MGEVEFKRISFSEIDSIKELWEGLKNHHQIKTTFFKERFENLNFEVRKAYLSGKAKDGKLIIDTVNINHGKIIAYCISSIDNKNDGEIDSIFIDENYRRMKIGEELMQRALKWFDDENVTTRRIIVAEGNEEAFEFYQKFGFYHIFNTLQQKKP